MPDAVLDSEHLWPQRFNNNDHGVWTYKDSSLYEKYWEYRERKWIQNWIKKGILGEMKAKPSIMNRY